MSNMKTKSPLKAQPHRLPGQSVQDERDRILEDFVNPWIWAAAFMVVIAVMEWGRLIFAQKPTPILFTIAAVVVCAVSTWRIRRVLPTLRALRQARDGERAVGQFLEALRTQGYQVFHDLVGDGFNVDHVIIGPAGVFTVETKTWSKPLKGAAEIHFDGDRIRIAGREPERDPVVQAKAQANWVRKLLTDGVGRAPPTKPVVVFPGWYVVNSRGAFGDIWILEPKALPSFLANEPPRLSDADVQLFAYHLSRHIRAEEAALLRA